MFTNAQLKIIDLHKEWCFGAYLQCCYLDYDNFHSAIESKKLPLKNKLEQLVSDMKVKKTAFDFNYLIELDDDCADFNCENPLKSEQQTWKVMSLVVEKYIISFEKYLLSYSSQTAQKGQISTYIEDWFSLIQKWNVLSNSYKVKYERNYESIKKREESLTELCASLS